MIFQVHSENMRKCGYGGIGRRAGFRYQWASRAGSSPVIRSRNRKEPLNEKYRRIGTFLSYQKREIQAEAEIEVA